MVVPSIVAVGMRRELYRWPRPVVARETGAVSDALPKVPHWIDGRAHSGSSTRHGDVFDPARGVVTKRVGFADAADVDAAVTAARDAFPKWGATSLAERSRTLFRFRELLHSRSEELAAIITSEHGKVL